MRITSGTVNDIGSLRRYVARALNSAGNLFARLVFVGSLRDAYTGRYLHEGWSGIASGEQVHATLREVHCAAFAAVLRLPLLEVSRELRCHFQSLNQPESETAQLWLDVEPFRDLIPQGCLPERRELFISQVRIALEVLRRAPDWSELSEPIASPPPPPDQSLLLQWLN